MIESGEIRQLSRRCHVQGCGTSSPAAVVYSARKSKDPVTCQRWAKALGLSEIKNAVHACQRHFPAGVPTKNHPDPNPKLLNPIPKQPTVTTPSIEHSNTFNNTPLFNHSIDGTLLGPDGKPLPAPVKPPPGSIKKLSKNATLIDINKIKKNSQSDKPFKIEEVTVIIDDKDMVKVVDYGSKDSLVPSPFHHNSNHRRKSKRDALQSVIYSDSLGPELSDDGGIEPSFDLFQKMNLPNTLEQMRQWRIDCNTALVDFNKENIVYAHRTILIAKSPYFYRHLYLRQKKLKCLQQFCRFTLPNDIDFGVLENVISFMYTGLMDSLWDKKPSSVRKILTLFEMNETLETYNIESVEHENDETESIQLKKRLKVEPEDNFPEFELTLLSDVKIKNETITNSEEILVEEKKKRRKTLEEVEDSFGKMKVSVQKIVENALNPFLGKIEELFDPSSSTLQIARSPQSIITLWHADILLTKLFDQNDLTKFFSQVMHEVTENNTINLQVPQTPGSYNVDVLTARTGNPFIDESYSKPSDGESLLQEVETITTCDMQIINYPQIDSQYIPRYVHMIAMYRFDILISRRSRAHDSVSNEKDTLMPPLLEGDVLPDENGVITNDLDELMNNMTGEDLLGENYASLTKSCFKKVSADLKRRAIADLELYVNPSFHEELIMHIVLDNMADKSILQLSLAVFLAKGCNFCRKKECKLEDLTLPITPDNPVCPDRQCIKRNLVCEICNKEMSNSKSLARHRYSVHDIQTGEQSGLFICSHCGEKFTKKWKLNMHERQHEDKKHQVTCHLCSKIMRGATALKKHINMVHETKAQYICDTCHKAFKRKETLSVHRRIHTGEKPYLCPQCDYKSETKGNLKAHMWRKHKLQLLSTHDQLLPEDGHQKLHLIGPDHHELQSEEHNPQGTSEEHAIAASYVAHAALTNGSILIGTQPSTTDFVT